MHDVAIVGGGPAGAWTAYHLARRGVSVGLIDDSHPREKPCGGGVTGRALQLVGASVAALGEGVPIRTARFEHAGNAATVDLPTESDGTSLAVVSRRVFDRWLVDRATEAGATPYATRATDVVRAEDGWRITTRNGEIAARWLVGADGPGSLVRRRVSSPFGRADLSIAAGYYVHGLTSRQIEIAFVSDPPGYLWSFPRQDHLASGVCAQADVSTSEQLLGITARWLDANTSGGRRVRYGWPIPSLRASSLERERPAGDGWLLVGDAAGLVDPITREGIYFALMSAEHAAAGLLEGRSPADAYVTRMRETIYPELLLAARLKARFYRPQFMALLVKALTRSGSIRRVMADLVAGEQPYHSLRRRLLRTFEWRLMTELFGLRQTR